MFLLPRPISLWKRRAQTSLFEVNTRRVFSMVETLSYKDEGVCVLPDVAESVARTVKGAALESEGAAT